MVSIKQVNIKQFKSDVLAGDHNHVVKITKTNNVSTSEYTSIKRSSEMAKYLCDFKHVIVNWDTVYNCCSTLSNKLFKENMSIFAEYTYWNRKPVDWTLGHILVASVKVF